MCGEQFQLGHAKAIQQGSPPRVRGTAAYQRTIAYQHRITPACAGNSVHQNYFSGQCQDHPRVCGEQHGLCIWSHAIQGSPPRVWGTAHPGWQSPAWGRITPACAGNRFQDIVPLLVFWDHPRVCGEQLACFCFCLTHKGSPPRVRGTAPAPGLPGALIRITPACAGNRNWQGDKTEIPWDHPRVCGEQISLCIKAVLF